MAICSIDFHCSESLEKYENDAVTPRDVKVNENPCIRPSENYLREANENALYCSLDVCLRYRVFSRITSSFIQNSYFTDVN